jgi:hypothetical protein
LFNKKYHSYCIHPLPNGSRLLTAIVFDLNIDKIKTIHILNLYNPPKSFEGLTELQTWFNLTNNRKIPTFLLMDLNLHHKLWNPPRYHHSHREASQLIKTCGQSGFKIVSEKGIPTFANNRSSQTTIDITWTNVIAAKFISSCLTSSSNHGSDHQSISLSLDFEANIQINKRLPCNLKEINVERFQADLQHNISQIPITSLSSTDNALISWLKE